MTDADDQALDFTVADEAAGRRLDAFLAEVCPEHSRNKIQTDLADGRVLVDGNARPKSYRLSAGERVVYRPGEVTPLQAVPQDLPLDIVYRDDDLVIVNKAAGMVVHPAVGHPDGTLVNALLYHLGGLAGGGDPLRPGIVHRLDRDTTGLLVVALNEQAHRRLAEQLKQRTMGRTYLALSWGRWSEPTGTLEGDIGRHPQNRQLMAVLPGRGRAAVTHYTVVEDFGFVQLCRVKLETGRTHQIRVHFTHYHHPIVGDPVYGDDRRVRNIHNLDRQPAKTMLSAAARQMLHAAALHLQHPRTGRDLEFEAPLPPDLSTALAGLRRSSPGV